jgi:hypothetical protein
LQPHTLQTLKETRCANWQLVLPLAIAAFLSTALFAQSAPATPSGCPVEILEANPQYHQYTSVAVRTYLQIRFRNVSGKEIRALKFGALFFNDLDEPTASYTSYIDSNPIKADDKRDKTGLWNQYSDIVAKADAYLIKVKFTDGTFWEDNGSYRCNAGVPELNIAKGGGLKAHEAAIKEFEKKTLRDTAQ